MSLRRFTENLELPKKISQSGTGFGYVFPPDAACPYLGSLPSLLLLGPTPVSTTKRMPAATLEAMLMTFVH